jgi:rhamnosyl/mannosyltransferase
MKVLEIGKFYPPQRGGMETVLHDLSAGLVRRGHRVRAIVAASGEDAVHETVDGVELRRLGNWGTIRSVPFCPSLPSEVRTSLRDLDPDVVHLHLPHPLGAVAWLVARDGRPLVVTYHSDIVRQRALGALYAPVGDRVLRRAEVIHVTSEALADQSRTLARWRHKCRAVPLGVDVEHWSKPDPARVQEWIDDLGPRFVLFVGRLVYYKGIDVLLEALRGTEVRLVVAGDGPMRTEWETLSKVLGLSDRVRFLGEVGERALPALYAAARAFVLPSQAPSEAFGLVQLEAMAAGLPLVVSRASEGVASVHEDGTTALLVERGDVEGLRDAVRRVHDDDDLARRLAEAGRRRVRAFYELEHTLDRVEALLLGAARGVSTAP